MQTVVGVFDSYDEAQSARESLLDAGFDDSAVRLQSNTAGQQSGDSITTNGRVITDSRSRGDDDEGFMASIGRFFSDLFGDDDNEHAGHYSEAVRRGSTVLAVTVADESRVEAARAALAAAGAVDIDKRTESWRQEGYSGFDPASRPYQDDEIQAERTRYQTDMARPGMAQANLSQTANDNGTVLPVVREELEVGKREVDLGAVRVFSRTETQPVQEQVQLREQHAEIERRPVDRPATEADLKAFEGGSIEVREMAERAVVSKTARVVEEVVVGTEATTRTETVSDQVRNTVVDVEKDPAGQNANNLRGTTDMPGSATATSMGADMGSLTGQSAPDYRSHYQSNFSTFGGSYEDYEPAYRYGSTLRSDPRYANRSWEDVEADAQRDWSSRNSGDTWEKTKAAVRHGWESMTGRR
ncbi:MAG: hypothetical protein JWR68_2292 [Polaromonas sp.]|nr:hypothetical protein [Polaromonas sp.]